MASFFALLQSGLFQLFLVIVWIGAAYFWQQHRGQREATDYAKAGVLAFVSLLTIAAELSETLVLAPENDGGKRPLSVNVDNLTQTVTIEFEMRCTGFGVCTKVPKPVVRQIPDCADLGSLDGCLDKAAILAALQTARYAFNRIEQMALNDPETIALVIDTSSTADFNQELGALPGTISEGSTPVSMQMEAELVGAAFKIEPEGRQRRELSTLNATRWDWQVTPQREGKHPLEVSLYVILTKEGAKVSEDKPLAERQVINVTVSRLDSLISFAQKLDPLRAFIFAVVAGLAGLLAWFGIKSWKDVSGKEPEEENPQKIEVTIKDGSDNAKDKKTDE